MGEINKELCELIKLAQGSRGQNQFAKQCGISSSSITKISIGEWTPKPKFLAKIAEKASNGVTYEMLMNAAGFLTPAQQEKSPTVSSEGVNSELNIPERYKDILIALNNGNENLEQEDIDDITKFIEFTANKRNKK